MGQTLRVQLISTRKHPSYANYPYYLPTPFIGSISYSRTKNIRELLTTEAVCIIANDRDSPTTVLRCCRQSFSTSKASREETAKKLLGDGWGGVSEGWGSAGWRGVMSEVGDRETRWYRSSRPSPTLTRRWTRGRSSR